MKIMFYPILTVVAVLATVAFGCQPRLVTEGDCGPQITSYAVALFNVAGAIKQKHSNAGVIILKSTNDPLAKSVTIVKAPNARVVLLPYLSDSIDADGVNNLVHHYNSLSVQEADKYVRNREFSNALRIYTNMLAYSENPITYGPLSNKVDMVQRMERGEASVKLTEDFEKLTSPLSSGQYGRLIDLE